MCEPSEDPDRILVEKVVNRFCRDFFPPLPIFYRYFLTGNLLCQSSSYRENYDNLSEKSPLQVSLIITIP